MRTANISSEGAKQEKQIRNNAPNCNSPLTFVRISKPHTIVRQNLMNIFGVLFALSGI